MMAAISLRAVPISLPPSQPVMFGKGTLEVVFYRPKSTWLQLRGEGTCSIKPSNITYNIH